MAFRLRSDNWTGSFGVHALLLALCFFLFGGHMMFLLLGVCLCLFDMVRGLGTEDRKPHRWVLVVLCLTMAGFMSSALAGDLVPAALVMLLPWIASLARGWFVWRLSPRGPAMAFYMLIALAPLIELLLLPSIFGTSVLGSLYSEEVNGRVISVDLDHLVLPLELISTGLTLLLLQHRRET